jgi:hypothetical protein
MRRIPRPSPATVIATIALVAAVGGTAYGFGENRPLLGGARNPSNDQTRALTKETEIIASNGTYGTRQSNKSNNGGGAIYGCRSGAGGSAANNEPCIRANNLSSGYAFEFNTSGTQGGVISTKDSTGRPFTTNATGVATGLNADRVDSLDADQLVANARSGLSPLKSMAFVNSTASNPDVAAARAAATEVPLATFGPFAIYGKCFVDTDAGLGATPQARAEVFARTTQDGAMLNSVTDTLDGDPAFLNSGTAEDERQVDTTAADSNGATLDLNNAPSTLVQADGTAFDIRILTGAKQGTLANGNGVWGASDRCAFGFSRFGAP